MVGLGDFTMLEYGQPVLSAIEWFLILFPGLSAVLAIATSLEYVRQTRRVPDLRFDTRDIETARLRWPSVTVVIPARNEEAHIAATIESVRNIDWPTVHIIVVDDASTDRTADILRSFGSSVTVITKRVNEGKARALNDAISSSSDGLVMIVDADCIVPRETVDLMARHLVKSDTIGAVTANPRVTKTSTFVEKLQAIEFSATVSATRRRWARGLALVLRTHWLQALRSIRQWPLLIESLLSIVWCHLIVVVTVTLVIARIVGESSATPILGSWAIGLLLLCTAHVMWGMRLDARRDPSIWSVLAWIPMFSVIYWTLSSLVVVSSTLPALLSRSKHDVVWTSARPTDPGLFDAKA